MCATRLLFIMALVFYGIDAFCTAADQNLEASRKSARRPLDETSFQVPVEFLDGPLPEIYDSKQLASKIQDLQSQLKANPTSPGPLHYTLGLLLRRQSKFKQAAEEFRLAFLAKYKPWHSILFLGMTKTDPNDRDQVIKFMETVIRRGEPSIQIIAHFYLYKIYFSTEAYELGMNELTRASQLDPGTSQVADEYRRLSISLLKTFNQSRWTLEASFFEQYDSNIAQNSSSVLAQSYVPPGVARSDLESTFTLNSSPLKKLQAAFFAQVAGNYNPQALAYEGLRQFAEFDLNLNPIQVTTEGLRVAGTLSQTGQTQNTPINGSAGPLTNYDRTIDTTAFLDLHLQEKWQWEFAFTYRDYTFYYDSDYSGYSYIPRITFSRSGYVGLINPEISLTYESNNAQNSAYQYNAVGFTAANTFHLSPVWATFIQLAWIPTQYWNTPAPQRFDTSKAITWRLIYNLTERWSAIAQATYTSNDSNQSIYSYNRFVGGLGMSWHY